MLGDPSYTPVAASDTDGDAATATDGQRLAQVLGLDPDAFARTQHGGLTGARNVTAMATLLWPTTWGYYLEQMMGDSVTPGQRAELAEPSRRAVGTGSRSIAGAAHGHDAHGILPCTPFDRWQAANDDIEAVFERLLVDILNLVVPFWREAVGRVALRRARAIRKRRSSPCSDSSRRRSPTGCARCSAASTGGT